MPLFRFFRGQQNNNTATFTFTCSGTPDNLFASANIQNFIYQFAGFDLRASLSFFLEDGVITLYNGLASWNGNNLSNLDGFFSIDTMNATLKTSYSGNLGSSPLTADLRVDFFSDYIPEKPSLFDIGKSLEQFTLRASVANLGWNTYSSAENEPFVCTFVHEPGVTAVYAGKNDALTGFLLDDGTFLLESTSEFPIQFQANGIIASPNISIAISGFYVDMMELYEFIPILPLVFTDGTISGNFTITGLLNDPEFNGLLAVSGIRFTAPDYLTGTYGPVDFEIQAEGKLLTIPSFLVASDKSAFLIDALFEFQHWLPTTIEVNTATLSNKPVLVNMRNNLFAISGSISFDLAISFSWEGLDITGVAGFEQGYFSTWPSSGGQTQDSTTNFDMNIDLTLNLGQKAEFRWVLAEVPILRSFIQADEPIRIALNTRTNNFQLRGAATLRGGEVFYLKRSFYLRQGSIIFNENQSRFDPIVSLRAEIRDRDEDGQSVRIILSAENQPLSNLVPVLSSEPPKSELELMVLLGQVATGDASRDTLWRDVIVVGSDFAAQLGIFRRVENAIRDFLHLDMFSIRTLLIQNAIFGTAMQNTSGNSSEKKMTIGNYFDNTTVYMGKYFGSAIFVDALVHFSYYDQETSQTTRENVVGNLLIQPEIGLEMNTPFFTLRWTNTLENLDTLFVADNSVSLSWKFSY
ncbi:translocation/assembly module TamB [Brucepastera parasyntrophica]|uniref:translocation/assembly module TamB domain-containing protein n=1 Tax=Brucepastera parasyntrophica TaxID=2880008 RepID=UPI00210A6428|nr:translocation/assembly module TamB domain-containing protein [Brucepastera parasyntrophica]ULQ59844.1 translocation/assembly module TamB [Brucepastera parasyntrophica]